MQVNLLVFDGAPEALGEDVVESAAAAIHADLDVGGTQQVSVLWAGKVAALVAVPDDRGGLAESLADSVQDEAEVDE